MVAWPAMKKLIVSSRICLSVSPAPVSSSVTSTSMLTRSSPPGERRRSAISGYRIESSRARRRSKRRGRGQRQPGGVDHRGQGRVGEGQDVADGRPGPVQVAPPVGLEQRGGQVGQADPDHLRLDVERPPAVGVARPGVEHLAGGLDELPAVALQGVAPEGRLGHAPGADPAGALGPDQAAADDRLEPVAHERRPRVVGRLVLEHVLDHVRVGQQVEGHGAAEADRVAVAPPGVEERVHVVPADLGDAAEQEVPPGPGRRAAVQRRDQLALSPARSR
jgi:hypothetical protein